MEILSLPFDELRKERERLAALHSHQILDTEPDEAYDRIVQIASYICGTPISLVSLVDASRQWFKAKVGLEMQETSRDVSFCSHAIRGEGIMEISDATQDERFRNNPLVTSDPSIRFYAGSPLVTPDGHKLGTLCVIDRVPRSLSAEQKQYLETLAQQIVSLMQLRQQKKQLQELNLQLLQDLESRLEQQDKVLHLFTRFVPDEIVAKHLSADHSNFDDAELKRMAILFCDIRGYTSMVEHLQPGQAVAILRSYYSILSDVVYTFSGMVNQYVGDEIFATFGAPFSFAAYEKAAVFCALEIRNQLEKLNEAIRPVTQVPLRVGIGIHAGEVITGTLGSRYKIEYAVTGDPVNTGKRIESLTQQHPNTILISQPVYEKVRDLVSVQPWPAVPVKGKSTLLEVYEVLGKK